MDDDDEMDPEEVVCWLAGSFQDWWHAWQAESEDMRNVPNFLMPFCRQIAEVSYTGGAARMLEKIAEESKKRWEEGC